MRVRDRDGYSGARVQERDGRDGGAVERRGWVCGCFGANAALRLRALLGGAVERRGWVCGCFGANAALHLRVLLGSAVERRGWACARCDANAALHPCYRPCRMQDEQTQPEPEPTAPLTRAQAAYTAGDFASVRSEAAAAAADPPYPEVAQQAHELTAKVAVDPWIYAVLAACLALFCAIVVTYAL